MNLRPPLEDTKLWSLWVVEIRFADDDNGWQPTCGVALSRDDARQAMAEWQQRNPEDRFRVREYRRY